MDPQHLRPWRHPSDRTRHNTADSEPHPLFYPNVDAAATGKRHTQHKPATSIPWRLLTTSLAQHHLHHMPQTQPPPFTKTMFPPQWQPGRTLPWLPSATRQANLQHLPPHMLLTHTHTHPCGAIDERRYRHHPRPQPNATPQTTTIPNHTKTLLYTYALYVGCTV